MLNSARVNSSAGGGRRECQVGLPPPNYAQERPGRAGRALDEMAVGQTRRPVRRGVIRAAVAAPAAAAGPPAAVAGLPEALPGGRPRPGPGFRRGGHRGRPTRVAATGPCAASPDARARAPRRAGYGFRFGYGAAVPRFPASAASDDWLCAPARAE